MHACKHELNYYCMLAMPDKPDNDSLQSQGGKARAAKLSKEQKQAIAKKAADARWGKPQFDPNRIPEAAYQGMLPIGAVELDCYVLDDGRRLFHKRGMAKAMGLKSDGGNAFMKTISRRGIGSNISEELWGKINNPLVFKPLSGDPAHGYDVTVLIDVCDSIIQARNAGDLAPQQAQLAMQAEIILRACAKLGIVALVDEATGYIADKKKGEYLELWKEFIQNECRAWEKEFPDQLANMIYRIYGLKRGSPYKHPQFFGKFIRRYIYQPLAGSRGALLKMLDDKNPVVYDNGGRRYKMHQFLTDVVGLPALRAQLWQVVGIGNSVKNADQFKKSFALAFPDPMESTQTEFDLGLDDVL